MNIPHEVHKVEGYNITFSIYVKYLWCIDDIWYLIFG